MPTYSGMLSERLVLPQEPAAPMNMTQRTPLDATAKMGATSRSQTGSQKALAAVHTKFNDLVPRVESMSSIDEEAAGVSVRVGGTLRGRRGHQDLNVYPVGQPIPFTRLDPKYQEQIRKEARAKALKKKEEERERQRSRAPPSRISSLATAVSGFMGLNRSCPSSLGSSMQSAQSTAAQGQLQTAAGSAPSLSQQASQVSKDAEKAKAKQAEKQTTKYTFADASAAGGAAHMEAAVKAEEMTAEEKQRKMLAKRRNQPAIPSPTADDASLGYSTAFDPYVRRRKRIVRTFLMLAEYQESDMVAEEAPVIIRG